MKARLVEFPARIRRYITKRTTHTLIRGQSGTTLAVYGDDTTTHRLTREYIGDDDAPSRTRGFNGLLGWQASALRLMKKHGMVAIYGKASTPELASHLLTQPRFVPLTVDIRESEQAFIASVPSARADINRARNRGFTYEFEKDPAWAREFHDRYHRPSIVGRHGDEAYVMSAEDIAHRVRHHGAQFICVVKDGVRVVGDLFEVTADHLRVMRLGWLDGDYAHVKSGAVAAKYWFIICHARRLGLRFVLLGGTPPNLENGVMRYKMKWNPSIDPRGGYWGEYHLLIEPSHESVQRLFARSAYILRSPDGGFMVLSGGKPADHLHGPAMLESLKAWYRLLPSPDPAREEENTLLPKALRAWAVSEPLNKGQ